MTDEEEHDLAVAMYDNPWHWAEKYLMLREAARGYLLVSNGLGPVRELLEAMVEDDLWLQ